MSKSISKEIKKNGKVTFDGPEVKQRKNFAPATKKEAPKKGRGSYNRKKVSEDEETKKPKVENTNIINFIDSIITKNYAEADKYIKQAVELKIQDKIEKEISTPLF